MKDVRLFIPGQGKRIQLSLALLLVIQLALVLAGCASLKPEIPANVINERAHSGGSVVAFSQSGELVASGGWEGTVRLWRLPEGSHMRHWRAHGDSVNGIAFLKQDSEIVTAGYDGMMARYAVSGELLERVSLPSAVTHMVADGDADRLVTGHRDGTVRLWKASDFTPLMERQLHRGEVRAVAISPDASRFASSSTDGSVVLWSEGGVIQELQTPPSDAWTLAFAPDRDELTGGSWFRLFRWRLDDGSLRIIPTEHLGIIKAVEYTDNGAQLATISRQTDSAVYFLDAQSGDVKRRFQRHDLCGGDISVSADGRYLATTSDDASVRFWSLDEAHIAED